jgi:hypothetical protein
LVAEKRRVAHHLFLGKRSPYASMGEFVIKRAHCRLWLAFGLITAGSVVFTNPAVEAQTTNVWNSSSNGKWETSSSWSLGVVPANTHSVFITNPASKTVTIDNLTGTNAAEGILITNLTVSAAAPATNTLSLSARELRVRRQVMINGGGAVIISNGTLRADEFPGIALTVNGEVILRSGGRVIVTNSNFAVMGFGGTGQVTLSSNSLWRSIGPSIATLSGNATLTINGGIFETIGSGLDLGIQVAGALGSTGTVWINNGTLLATNSASTIGIGRGSVILSNGIVRTSSIYVGRIRGPGKLSVHGGSWHSTGFLDVGVQGGTGDVYVTGGQLVVTNSGGGFAIGTIFLGENGLGRMTISNGTVIARDLIIASNSVARGELNVVGGTLIVLSQSGGMVVGQTPLGTGMVTAVGGEIVATNSTTVVGGSGTGIMLTSNTILRLRSAQVGAVSGSVGKVSIESGTTMTMSSNLIVGGSTGSTGIVTVVNSSLLVSNYMVAIGNTGTTLGSGGSGTMVVSNSTMVANKVLLGSTGGGSGLLILRLGAFLSLHNSVEGDPGRLATNEILVDGGTVEGSNATLTAGENHPGSITISNGLATFRSVYIGLNSAGTLLMPGGTMRVLSNMVAGDCSASVTGNVTTSGGSLFVTNTSGNAEFEVRSGTLTLTGGLLVADKLVITNVCGRFIHTGGTLMTGTNIITAAFDADGDGIPNSFDFDPFNPADADSDPDGDGQNNLAEYQAGTNPTNSASAFRITSIAPVTNSLRVTWTTVANRTNALERSAGVAGSFSNNFTAIFIATNTAAGTTNYVDVGAATNVPAFYYRVRLVP